METTFTELIEIIENSVADVQIKFDNYQMECFTQRTPEFFCLELNGEAGELANLEKKAWIGKQIDKEKFEDEAADVLIALMNYCNSKSINLGKATKDKLAKIERKRFKLKSEGQAY